MDLLEFGRIIHAEMSAISDAARKGVAIQGATLYSTTFPCHLCAKHIVASGIKRVVYLEPYPKSYANALHGDSIEVDSGRKSERVTEDTFLKGFRRIGIATCLKRANVNYLEAPLSNGIKGKDAR